LQTTIEELETSNEELKSTNEELQSTNEELQSTNEEMETSKEELQSLNEESTTVNSELQSRIDDLSKAHDDMQNLLDSTEVATLFLDTELCIRRFTPKATNIIPLTGTDSGRPIKHFASNLMNTDLADLGSKVLEDLIVREIEAKSRNNRVYLIKARPYRTISNMIDGVVITFDDISDRKIAEEIIQASEKRYRTLFELASDSIVLFDADTGKIMEFNQRAYEHLGYTHEEFAKMTVADIETEESIEDVVERLRRIADKGSDLYETQHQTKEGGNLKVQVKIKKIIIGDKKCLLSTWQDLKSKCP